MLSIHVFVNDWDAGPAGRAMPKRIFKRIETVDGEQAELTVAREVACAGRFVGRLDLEKAYVALRGTGEAAGSHRCLVAYVLLAYAWGMRTLRRADDREWARVPTVLLGEWGIDRSNRSKVLARLRRLGLVDTRQVGRGALRFRLLGVPDPVQARRGRGGPAV
jgi:hypothetical protein